MSKRALITGITGQDGSYLAEFLLMRGYEVHGIRRRSSNFNTARIDHLYADPHGPGSGLVLHYGDLSDSSSLRRILERVNPDELYNLGAQSHVRVSFEQAEYTADTVATGTLRVLEALRDYSDHTGRGIRMYQAGSSEMYGSAPAPQSESTCFQPRSPYAVSKVAAHYFCVNYREAYGLHISNGILFNHESPRRNETFVSRKITKGLARIKLGLQKKLYLGNLEAKRDWGFAGDYVEAMWRMLQQPAPGDYVIATGESHSVRELLDETAEYLGVCWQDYVEIDPQYFRPTEVDYLLGDASQARDRLGWTPRIGFKSLVQMMADHDMELASCDITLLRAGHTGIAMGAGTD
jgi:GDPmannose 4,6-dehydratase